MDRLGRERRSLLMSKVRQKGTDIERLVGRELRRSGHRFQKNLKGLPGSPDLVFRRHRVAVFIDGDFWHGYRYPRWRHKLRPFWREKIEANRRRDQRNIRRLKRSGWRVLRIWQHEIRNDLGKCVQRIVVALTQSGGGASL